MKVHVEFTAEVDGKAYAQAHGIELEEVRAHIRRALVARFETDCRESEVESEVLAVT